tara:strand:+ start:1987 stop:2913 length:927 start_codon:yes stop_codon:yes gene_type:complete
MTGIVINLNNEFDSEPIDFSKMREWYPPEKYIKSLYFFLLPDEHINSLSKRNCMFAREVHGMIMNFLNKNKSIFYYSGNLVNNVPNGQGIIFYYDSDKNKVTKIYEGGFVDNMPNGKGKIYDYMACGESNVPEVYTGDIKDSFPHGYGVIEDTILFDQKKYKISFEGRFLNGLKNGPGKIFFCNNLDFIGTFADDYKEGFGVQFDYTKGLNHKVFEGLYSKDKKNGIGIYHLDDGTEISGFWVDGEISDYQFCAIKNLIDSYSNMVYVDTKVLNFDGCKIKFGSFENNFDTRKLLLDYLYTYTSGKFF